MDGLINSIKLDLNQNTNKVLLLIRWIRAQLDIYNTWFEKNNCKSSLFKTNILYQNRKKYNRSLLKKEI